MLWTRIASGVVLAPLFLALVYLGDPYFNVLVAASAGVIAWEFLRMDGKEGVARRALVIGTAIAAVALVTLGFPIGGVAAVAAGTIVLVASDQKAGRAGVHMVQISLAYAAFPALALIYLMNTGGTVSVFWLVAVVWATDIGAYAFGRLIGGPKLAPAISPNKTWSGAVGGLAAAMLFSALLLQGFGGQVSATILALAALASIVSQAGDLFESALKRRYQVKDSGALIPGHGGVMDRFDGLWAAAPAAALFCAILGGGVQQW